MVFKGIVIRHEISKAGLGVHQAKIEVTSKLPPPTNEKAFRSFMGHVGFYKRFV